MAMDRVSGVGRTDEHVNWTPGGPVVSHLPDGNVAAVEGWASATVAEPIPLGLFGFATGTWIVATVISGILPISATASVAPVLLVVAGLTQFIAGLWAFRRTNALAATAFCAFGAFNVTFAMMYLLQAAAVPLQAGTLPPINPNAQVVEGFVLESFGFISLALMIAALKTNFGLVAVLGTLAVGYVLAGIPDLTGATASGGSLIGDLGGYFLMASALFAYYTGMAVVVNSTWKRQVFPIGGKP